MTNSQISKVVYKQDPMSTKEYIVIVNPEAYVSWKNGDKTIPLADVVGSFQIMTSGQGQQGIMGQVSKQEIHTVFGTNKEDEAIVMLLERGTLQAGTLKGNDLSGRSAKGSGGSGGAGR
jgi:hypothetical protein